jgi:organic radical activating enzyme
MTGDRGNPPHAVLKEVFSSAQGEGLYLGRRQAFVRFAGCNRHCRYCDTPSSRNSESPTWLKEREPGSGSFEERSNPVDPDVLLEAVSALETFPGFHHSVSLTGGEPLLWADFLEAFLPRLRGKGFVAYLETNADLPEALGRLAGRVDIVAADLKLPSATGEDLDWERAGRFLEAGTSMQLFVKIVVSREAGDGEMDRAFGLIRDRAGGVPCVLQPVTETPAGPGPPEPERLLDLQARGLRVLSDVRIIPQMHKAAGIL